MKSAQMFNSHVPMIFFSQNQVQPNSDYYLYSDNSNGSSMHNILAALRAFRLLRVFKLASTWKKFSDLMKTVWKTLKDVSTFSLFLLLFLFIYALLGMELFAYGCKMTPDNKIDMVNGSYPLNNFNTFYEAMLTMFVLLTGDQWTIIMLDFYRAVSPSISILFTISFMILGLYMLLNLFLAILLQNFDEDSIEEEMQKKLIRRHEIDKIIRKKKLERFFKRLLHACVKRCCICFYKRVKKDLAVEDNDEDLDPDKMIYVKSGLQIIIKSQRKRQKDS